MSSNCRNRPILPDSHDGGRSRADLGQRGDLRGHPVQLRALGFAEGGDPAEIVEREGLGAQGADELGDIVDSDEEFLVLVAELEGPQVPETARAVLLEQQHGFTAGPGARQPLRFQVAGEVGVAILVADGL